MFNKKLKKEIDRMQEVNYELYCKVQSLERKTLAFDMVDSVLLIKKLADTEERLKKLESVKSEADILKDEEFECVDKSNAIKEDIFKRLRQVDEVLENYRKRSLPYTDAEILCGREKLHEAIYYLTKL